MPASLPLLWSDNTTNTSCVVSVTPQSLEMIPGNSFPKEVVEDLKNVAEGGIENVFTATEEILNSIGVETVGENISKDVKAVLFTLTFLVKGRFRELEAKNMLDSLGLGEKVTLAIVESYSRVSAKYAVVMKNSQTLTKLHFKKLDWRFQVTLASRSFLKQNEPKILTTLCLEMKNKDEDDKEVTMEMDLKMLQMLVNRMEEALAESYSPLAKKLARN